MRIRRDFRTALAAAAASALLVVGQIPAEAAPTPSPTPTTVADAKAQVRELERQASEIGEDYDIAVDALEAARNRLKVLASDIAAQQLKVDALVEQVRAIALLQFRNRDVDPTIQVFTSGDPDTLLDRLATATKIDQDMQATLAEHQAERANLLDLQRTQAAEVAALAAAEQRQAELKKQVEERVDAAELLLTQLTEAERDDLEAGDGGRIDVDPGDLDDPSANARAMGAVRYAVSRVRGGQYVWGADGPRNFDCSGLMLAAYRSVGISLPHSSRSQARVGRAVSRSELRPGDLIFWYSPIHHVGMYIGNGKIVHARNTRSDLVVQTLASYPAPYSGARRVVG